MKDESVRLLACRAREPQRAAGSGERQPSQLITVTTPWQRGGWPGKGRVAPTVLRARREGEEGRRSLELPGQRLCRAWGQELPSLAPSLGRGQCRSGTEPRARSQPSGCTDGRFSCQSPSYWLCDLRQITQSL